MFCEDSPAASNRCTLARQPARPPCCRFCRASGAPKVRYSSAGGSDSRTGASVIHVHADRNPRIFTENDGRRGFAAAGSPSADPADAGVLGSFIAQVTGAESSRRGGGTAIEAPPRSTASPPDTLAPDFGGSSSGGSGDAPWRSLARAESDAAQSGGDVDGGPSGESGAAPPSPPRPSGNGLAERDERALASSAEGELDPARTPFHQCAPTPPLPTPHAPPHTRACALPDAHAHAHVQALICCRLPIISPCTSHLGPQI